MRLRNLGSGIIAESMTVAAKALVVLIYCALPVLDPAKYARDPIPAVEAALVAFCGFLALLSTGDTGT
jgi:hypothetical protein